MQGPQIILSLILDYLNEARAGHSFGFPSLVIRGLLAFYELQLCLEGCGNPRPGAGDGYP